MLSFIGVLALSVQLLAPYLVWPSRWNVPTHSTLAACISVYVIPGLLTNVWDDYPTWLTAEFVQVNVLGAVTICAGTVLGGFFARKRLPVSSEPLWSFNPAATRVMNQVIVIITPCVIGMILSYGIMGFVPIFSEDPFSARQFKGIYQEPYYRVAYLYRFCFSILESSLALVLAVAWVRKSALIFMLATSAFIVLFISLSRGPAAAGILLFLGAYAARRKGLLRWYFAFVVLVFPLGSTLFYFLGQILGTKSLQASAVGLTFADSIAAGAPDISDQLGWLQGFLKGDYYTYGRTMFGGLVPFSYPWNPAVWTLTYDQVGADISEINSGGLRLSVAEWGFANFGWAGVVFIPLLSGLISGAIVTRMKSIVPQLNLLQYVSLLMLYGTLGIQLVQFYILSIHSIPAIVISIYFWRVVTRRSHPKSRISVLSVV